ncbi:MAG: TonB-dependent receptor [Bacteroidales bacterium]|nr:TonB-dependent receptor [Bacteroidales bacterium]
MIFFIMSGMQLFAQKTTVRGTVTDETSGSSIPGVNVLIKGTYQGAITDVDGNFTIEVSGPSDVLVFTCIGYEASEMTVGTSTTLDVSLKVETLDLDEIVFVGYGVQKKSDLTGSVASVSSEQLNNIPIPSIEHALQGLASGVNIIPKSGRPGEGADIQIRGITSVNGTAPLVIIDGVYGSLDQLNPSDIESIEILKDASSAAIYGATGGNGVILVTTKKGKSGGMKVSASFYRGIDSPVGTLDMMNSQEYLELLEEIDYRSTVPLNYQRDTLPTYDWQDICFQDAISDNYDLSVSGGTDASHFMFSTSLNRQGGIVRNTDYQRFTMRLNADQQVNKHITVDEKITFVNTQTEGFDQWYWHNFYNNPIVGIIEMDPTVPAYDENGVWTISPNNVGNPIVNLDMKDKLAKANHFSGNFGVKINLFKGFDFQSRVSGKLSLSDAKEYEAIYWASATNYNNQDKLIMDMRKDMSYNIQNYVNYTTSIADAHNINVMMGVEQGRWWYYNIYGTRVDMKNPDPNMLYLSMSTNSEADIQNVEGRADISADMAYFGRFNYDYKSKYLMTFNIRRDGSSKLAPSNRWDMFPSFSLGWKFTEEAFMQNVPFISSGKVRFGYGETGANAKTGFPYLATVESRDVFRYTVDGAATQVGTAPNKIANPSLMWEHVKMSNLGLDMTFFNNRVSLVVDLFNKVNDGMILTKEVSSIAGTYGGQDPEVNFGSISNKGIEVSAGVKKKSGDLTGSFDLNFAIVKNEVIELPDDSIQDGAVHTLNPTSITLEGYPVAQFFGLQTDGMFLEADPTEVINDKTVITNQPYYERPDGTRVYAQPNAKPGDARFVDQNDDGKIDSYDRVLLGSPLPTLSYGFTLNLQYKGFDFTAFFNGVYGNELMNGTKQYLYNPVGYGNRGAALTDRYRDEIVKDGIVVVTENHDTDLYRFSSSNYTKMSDFFVEDGSYLRLRNVMLGYTIPSKVTNLVGVEKLRLYVGGKNLFTLTNYSGLNPEVGGNTITTSGVDIGLYPVTKMIYFGANIVF